MQFDTSRVLTEVTVVEDRAGVLKCLVAELKVYGRVELLEIVRFDKGWAFQKFTEFYMRTVLLVIMEKVFCC